MGKRGSATRPKNEDSTNIGPDSDKDTTDSEPEKTAKEAVEPLVKKQKTTEVEESDDDSDNAGEAKAKGEEKTGDPCKVIVSHIPWAEKDKKEVLKIFDGCGDIVTHDMPPRVGIIVFNSKDAAKKAQLKSGTEFRGGKLKIRLASAPIPASQTSASKRARRKKKVLAEKAKAAGKADPAGSKADPPAKGAAEGKKPGSKIRRGAGKGRHQKAKSGKEGTAKDKVQKGQALLAKDKEERHQKKAMTRDDRRKSYAEAAKLGAKGRGGGQPFLGRGGGRGQGEGAGMGGGKPFAGRGGGKPFAGRGGGGGTQDKKAAASED